MRRRWRFYESSNGSPITRRELARLSEDAAAALAAEMRVVARLGLRDGGARHLRNDIWEVRAHGEEIAVRALFAKQGRSGHILLALHFFTKKTQATPKQKIDLAEKRLVDWISRGAGGRT